MIYQITTKGYGYVAPTVDKARKNLPLIDAVHQRIEPITATVIKKADGIVDAGYKVVEDRVVAIKGTISSAKGSVYQKASPVVDKVVAYKSAATGKALKAYNENPVILSVHKKGLSFCDMTEALIDRLLPEPVTEASKTGQKKDQQGKDTLVLYRAIALPFRIPARTIHIIAFKVDGMIQAMVVKAKWGVQLTRDQKAKLSKHVADSSRQLMDKVSNSSTIVSLKSGKTTAARKLEIARKSIADGQRAIAVKCYIVCEKFGLIELKEITFEKLDQLQIVAVSAAKAASTGAHTLTKRVAGDERATVIFTKIGEKIPLVKSAIFPEASTGSLEAVAPPAPARMQAGTGAPGPVRASLHMPQSRPVPWKPPQMKRSEAVETGLSAVPAHLRPSEIDN